MAPTNTKFSHLVAAAAAAMNTPWPERSPPARPSAHPVASIPRIVSSSSFMSDNHPHCDRLPPRVR